ncbi:unnamed protein product [Didymodactylos carnosus]|uniref:Uncharacterized protein n=1 Tax=Didymodactylos carnosus TaxID=1234261 RepID=A0A814PP92_9BILA|nr:unnamed protein product [Didymodactylos carnosus]CAF1202443.1 unnamed protein product [Didymodactylos carnosus]CAF3873127.1 unnamed protein product [Didymodactylos carnosus]CAF4012253.1 unnamed protein product [Didymodactylos carnosus]
MEWPSQYEITMVAKAEFMYQFTTINEGRNITADQAWIFFLKAARTYSEEMRGITQAKKEECERANQPWFNEKFKAVDNGNDINVEQAWKLFEEYRNHMREEFAKIKATVEHPRGVVLEENGSIKC